MKKAITIGIAFSVIISFYVAAQDLYWGGKTLSSAAVKAKWGSEKYKADEFKNGNVSTRAKMAYSIMTDKTLIGLAQTEIRARFGGHDGFYFRDTYPAYIIQEGKSIKDETWQIVFKIGDGYKVRDIIVHKNCCEP